MIDPIRHGTSKIWYNMNISMDFILFCPDVMKWRPLRIFESNFQRKIRKKPENKIRPAKAIFDGVVKPLVRGAVKNHNPRIYLDSFFMKKEFIKRGTETSC